MLLLSLLSLSLLLLLLLLLSLLSLLLFQFPTVTVCPDSLTPVDNWAPVEAVANLLKTNGWQPGAPYGEGTPNFEVMREWNRAVTYRKTIVLFAERILEP